MTTPDLALLAPLDVLLTEGSVARAADRLGLSPSAMSRTLTRLREATGDPLLVRAGRGLVPTPRALELRERVALLVQDGTSVLRPAQALDLRGLSRTFTIRTGEGFVESFGPALLARVAKEAPGVRLRFLQRQSRDATALRDGNVDLETGIVGAATHPELRAQGLFRDRLVGVVRRSHPLAGAKITAKRYANAKHVVVARRGPGPGGVERALEEVGLRRDVTVVVGGFSAALALARSVDLVATVPARHTESLRAGMHAFPLPFAMPEMTVSLLWHPRMDSDAAHRWLRGVVIGICRE
jgi:DNA-binding transcriptional LysR family regulator